MSKITINNEYSYFDLIKNVGHMHFNYLEQPIYDAQKVESLYATYFSPPIETHSYIAKYGKVTWIDTSDALSKVFLYARSSSSNTFEDVDWIGPFWGGSADLSSLSESFIQFCFVIKGVENHWPTVSSISIPYYVYQDMVKFFTKTFDIGFSPQNVVLTSNPRADENTIIRYALTGLDTTDTQYYQYIPVNKITKLTEWPFASKKLKILIEFIGNTEMKPRVDEFALIFSGEDGSKQFRINK